MSEGRALLFVYGTLKRGEVAHARLNGARFVAEAATPPCYTLLDCGWYPGLADGGDTAVRGEIFEISTELFPDLDVFEDVPELYQRHVREIGGFEVWIYVLQPEHRSSYPRLELSSWTGSGRGP